MFETLVPTALAVSDSPSATHVVHQGGDFGFFIVLAVFFAVFYFLVIRPQNKRAKEHRETLDKLVLGDEVVTSGGVLGVIKRLEGDFLILEIAEGIDIKIQKPAVAACLPKGTLAAI
ncbi:MAG: preprotein translocase subunit YajC [Gammaproteobacteria bacterium]